MTETQVCPQCKRRMERAACIYHEWYGNDYYTTYFLCRPCKQWYEEEFTDIFCGPVTIQLEPISAADMLNALANNSVRPKLADKLELVDIPAPSSDWDVICNFALTFDGYAVWGSPVRCAEIADAKFDDSLIDLRTRLFLEQRRWHHYGDDPDEEEMQYFHELVEKIRRWVAAEESAASG